MFPCLLLENTSTSLIYMGLASSVNISETVLEFPSTKQRHVSYLIRTNILNAGDHVRDKPKRQQQEKLELLKRKY